jgi:uncharacterized membrane protein YeaQ/YmgE (transglycosylase-associated protein family)
MVLVWVILIGLLVGAVAKFLMPGDDPGGIVVTVLIGIAGEGAGFIGAVVGSILLLAAYRAVAHG